MFINIDPRLSNNYTTNAINTADTSFPPCMGWTFSFGAINFTADNCSSLDNKTFDVGEFTVLPNPFTNSFSIHSQEKASLTVSDAFGKLIKKQDLNVGNNIVDFAKESSGMYFAKIQNTKGSEVIKLIKE